MTRLRLRFVTYSVLVALTNCLLLFAHEQKPKLTGLVPSKIEACSMSDYFQAPAKTTDDIVNLDNASIDNSVDVAHSFESDPCDVPVPFKQLIPAPLVSEQSCSVVMYFCTATDSFYFPMLINLIGSICRSNFDKTHEIAVFDLGMNNEQRTLLETMQKVHVYDVELTHPHLLTPLPINSYKSVPGLYAWKPVVIKQALDKFPYVLYLDAGTTVLKPLDDLFKHIIQNGYFLTDCGHNIAWMTKRSLIEKFNLQSAQRQWILDQSTVGVAGGIQGHTNHLYNSFIMPMYELSKDLENFRDDGTTPAGFGTGRH